MGRQNSAVHASLPPSSKTQNPTQDTVRARSLGLRGTCWLYPACPYGEGVALKSPCPLTGSWDSGQLSLRQRFGQNTAHFAVFAQGYLKRMEARDVGLIYARRSTIHQNLSNDGLEFF